MTVTVDKTENIEEFEKIKWWCGTVVIGALPVLIRLAFYFFSNYNIDMLAIPEIVCFGFGIQISVIFSNIQAIKKKRSSVNFILTTVSIVFIIIFSIFYSLSLITPSPLDNFKSSIFLSLLCIVSLFIGHVSVKNAIIEEISIPKQGKQEGA